MQRYFQDSLIQLYTPILFRVITSRGGCIITASLLFAERMLFLGTHKRCGAVNSGGSKFYFYIFRFQYSYMEH